MFTRSIITRLTLALIIGVAALLLVTSITATAATTASAIARPQADLSVNPGESIQAAIDAANDGDTILVNAGDYTESLTLSKPVSLTGVNSDTTIIHAMPNQRVLTVTGATITNSVVISGLTFTGGQSDIGAGLFITDSAQPIIHSIIATHNRATTRGGGLYTTEALTMTKSQFIDNLAFDFAGHPGYGGGVYAADQAQIAQSQFISNLSPYGAGMYAAHEVSVSATEFISNFAMEGAGLNGAGEVSVFQGLFSGNFGSGGGGSAISAEQVLVVTGTRFVNNSTSEEGGAVFAYHGPVTMTQAQFTNNRTTFKSGGAVYVYSGRLHVSASQFISNSAYANGGAIYANDTADLINVSFISNTALQSGGGLYASEAVTLANVDFISNTALQYGGGAYISDTAILIDTDFISNTARQSGGGAYLAGSATMFDGRFEGNQTLSGDGGGMLSFSSPLELTGTIFIRNSAITGGGGGLVYGGSHARIVNALFSGNTNNMWGAAITTFPNSEMEILNSTITYPGSNPQWAITNIGAELHVTNTIITSHSLAIAGTYQRTTEDYNLFYGNINNTVGVITGAHSLIGDPRFVDPAHDDYHLAFGSAAIDRGVNAGVYTDLDGNARPIGSGFDIGAYEFQGGTRYVATTGDDTSNLCLDQLSPCATLQHAIDVASEHDELRIASGTYTDMSVRPRNDITTTGVVTQVAYLSKTLTLRGGYTLTNWLTPDPVINQTILDAQAQGRVVYITGNISPTLDGLRLTHGNPRVALAVDECTDYWTCEADGGAIYVQTAALTLTNSRIDSNYFGRFDGGAVYVRIGHADLIHNEIVSNSNSGIMLANSTGFISGNVIFSNTTNGNGAGVLVKYSTARLVNNTILSNTADYVCGGGVCIAYGSAVLEGNLIRGNAFVRSGLGCGGGVDIFLSTATLKGNRIEDNTAYDEYGTGGGICIEASSQADLIGNVIRRNSTTGQGGGVYIGSQTHANLLGNTIVDNISGQGGGVGVNWLSSASLINNLVAHNPSASQLYVSGSQVDLLHTTLVDGSSTGLYVTSYQFNQEPPIFSTVALTNTLIASHTVGIDVSQGNTLTLNGLLWHGTPITISQTGTATIFVQNEFYGDPRFVDPAHDDYHLAFGSAAIDRGVNAGVYTDLDGHVRPIGPGFDIGAYESVAYRAFLPVMWR